MCPSLRRPPLSSLICKKQLKSRFLRKKTQKYFAVWKIGCNFASLFGSRGPRSELSGFFDALLNGCRGRKPEIIEMFAMRKSDKQVRDKEGIPRISGRDS